MEITSEKGMFRQGTIIIFYFLILIILCLFIRLLTKRTLILTEDA